MVTFASKSEAEYYWMFLLEDNGDILNNMQYEMQDIEHGVFGDNAVSLRIGQFNSAERANESCKMLQNRNIACVIS